MQEGLQLRNVGSLMETQNDADGPAQHITTNTIIDSQAQAGGPINRNSGVSDADTLPRLHFSFNWIYLFLYIVFLLLLNVLMPCLLFYLLQKGVFHFGTCSASMLTSA